MPITKFQVRPGINRELTAFSNEGGWFDGDKIRFRFGFPEKIGGWEATGSDNFLGTCRALHSWVSLSGGHYLGMGTHLKYYINEGNALFDITPIRLETSPGDVTFSVGHSALSEDILPSQETISLENASSFPNSGIAKIEDEVFSYAGKSSNDLTGCLRGVRGTLPIAHDSTTPVSCATAIVHHTNHAALRDNFVSFSGAIALGGNIVSGMLNQEYQIITINDQDSYYINLREPSPLGSLVTPLGIVDSLAYPSSLDLGDGGSAIVGKYQTHTNINLGVSGTGWGSGGWSRGGWGSSIDRSQEGETFGIWSHDNFGEDLVINLRDRGIYYWDKTNGTSERAIELKDLPNAKSPPTIAKKVLISDRDRHVLAFGCDSQTSPGIQDPLLIRFSNQESVIEWEAEAENTSGDLLVGTGSEIVTAVETKQQILVFTDTSLHSMQYIGPPYTFGIILISTNLTIAGPLAAVAVDDSVFWMGDREFYVYSGTVQRLPCTVRDYVFNDFNFDQKDKVTAGTNTSFAEVWWFYPSSDSTENNKYVIFNYQQQLWYFGELDRTCWLDRGIEDFPIAAGTDNLLYYHETGVDDGSVPGKKGIYSYIESSPVDIGEGENFIFLRKLIPDVTFRGSIAENASLLIYLKAGDFPGDGAPTLQFGGAGKPQIAHEEAYPIDTFTNQLDLRVRGRYLALRVESSLLGVTWRLGTPRIDISPDGKR